VLVLSLLPPLEPSPPLVLVLARLSGLPAVAAKTFPKLTWWVVWVA